MASICVIEGTDSLLLVSGTLVINGSWNLARDSEGLHIPNDSKFNRQVRGRRVRCVREQAPSGEDYNDILEKAREMMRMPLFDRTPHQFYNAYLGQPEGENNGMESRRNTLRE